MKNKLLLMTLSLFLISCSAVQEDTQPEVGSFMIAAWTGGGIAETEAEWRELANLSIRRIYSYPLKLRKQFK